MKERYLLEQPKLLGDLALDRLAVWIGIQASNIQPTIAELRKRDPVRADNVLSRYIEILRDRYEYNVPKMSQNLLLAKTIVELYRISREISNRFTDINDIETAIITNERMVETVFTKYVTTLLLPFEQFNFIRKSFRAKAHMLISLDNLALNSHTYSCNTYYSDEIEDDIIHILQQLPTLEYLNVLIPDTDDIVRCFIKYCPLIEELIIDSSYPVSDDTVTLLSQLPYLRTIAFGADVTSTGYEIILLNCRNMENIYCIKHYERIKMTAAISRIASEPSVETLNLQSYKINRNTIQELRTVFRICPMLESLIVSHANEAMHENVDFMMSITEVEDLSTLTICGLSGPSIYEALDNALSMVGYKLEHLHFFGGTEIDLKTMIDISQTCPNLQTLQIEQSEKKLARDQIERQVIRKVEIPPFKNLTKLIYKVNYKLITAEGVKLVHEAIFFLLSNCVNVEYIDFRMPNWSTEDVMLKVLDKNPLKYLQTLKILHSPGQMTPLVMERLIKNCINDVEVIEIV